MSVIELRAGSASHVFDGEPWLMGIVNATPDSFSDGGMHPTLEARVALASELRSAGADLVDVGGESGVTNRPAVDAAEEIERVVPLVSALCALGTVVSVDTHKPAVAAAAIAAGASIVNDVSGLRDPGLADVCAQSGAGLVVMHTAAPPKQRIQDPGLYADVLEDVMRFLSERLELARSRGVADQQLIVDPGPDFAKTPAQTVELLRGARRLHEFGRPLLLAISRKDFVGAITQRAPRERGAGTLAALAHGMDLGAHIYRVHDVAAAADFIAVLSALRGAREVPAQLSLADALRWEQPSQRLE
ncbi:MAG TPA: dihydropteroate synthase [Solirubrobacteraceae bacterium]|jgi:dihydropteroate synthase|nr:dihydropteroate synthase [Solirubrobacteraceae bacterium]